MRVVWKHAVTNALRLWRETLPLFAVCLIAAAVLAASSLLSGYSSALYDSLSEKYTTTVRMYVSPIYSQTGEQISE